MSRESDNAIKKMAQSQRNMFAKVAILITWNIIPMTVYQLNIHFIVVVEFLQDCKNVTDRENTSRSFLDYEHEYLLFIT